MKKEEYSMLQEIKLLDNNISKLIDSKEIEIKVLEAEIEQLYEFRKEVQRLGELESIRINGQKEV